MSKRKVLELFFEGIELEQAGSVRRGAGTHVVLVTLVWPRPAIAERNAVKTFTLEDNMADLKGASWSSRIVFKEVVEGQFGIMVSVTEAFNDSQLSKFLSFAASSVLKTVGGEVEDLLDIPLAGQVAGMPFLFLSKMVKNASDLPADVLGAGELDVKVSSWTKAPVKKQLEIPLRVPQTVYKPARRTKRGKGPVRRQVLLKKGADNGRLIFSAVIK